MTKDDLAPQTTVNFPSLGNPDAYDVLIVGGGPAGLSGALVLGRCRRKVLVVDAGEPRNRWSKSMHGYLSRDGMNPCELLAVCRKELETYRTVEIIQGKAVDVCKTQDGRFITILENGSRYMSRKLLFATGVVDEIPKIEGLLDLYGTSVHHCPYCDGYEWRDRRVAVYAKEMKGFGTVQELTAWTRDLVLCTDGPSGLDDDKRRYLNEMRIELREDPVARLEGAEGKLQSIVFQDGTRLERDALFFVTGHSLACDIALQLGCRLTEEGCVWTGQHEATDVEGVYCAGDASCNVQMVIIAAAEGAQAAVSINRCLTGEYKEHKQVKVPDKAGVARCTSES